MQFRVPQNIDMEDKIVGSLTMRQFIYLLIGGAIDYIFYLKYGADHIGLFIVIGGPIALFCLALAFLKIQDQPFADFLVALVTYSYRPRQRIWHRAEEESGPISQANAKKTDFNKGPVKKKLNLQQVQQITRVLDSGGEVNTKGSVIGTGSKAKIDLGRK